MHDWLIDIGKHTAAQIDSLTWGENVFAEHMPKSPDTSVVFRDAGGQLKDKDIPHSTVILEVEVRGATPQEAKSLSEDIWDELAFKDGFEANSNTRVIFSVGESMPRFVGMQQKRLCLFSARYSFELEHSKY